MPYFITIQYPYQDIIITLSHDRTILASQTISKIQAVGQLLPTCDQLLIEQNLLLSDIHCIGINTGPGPFNTLRSIIATANGIAFASKIPLIGSNGLDLILDNTDEHTVAILDAFGTDVYFAIKAYGKQGYTSIENLMEELNNLYAGKVLMFVGNGTTKHQDFLAQNFAGIAKFHGDLAFATTQSLIDATYKKFLAHETSQELFPLYFASPIKKP